MSDHKPHHTRFQFRRLSRKTFAGLLKPVAVTGAGSTAIAIWFEEMMLFAEEILALIFLPIMAGVIYLLDILIFKSRMPKREDLTNTDVRGAKK